MSNDKTNMNYRELRQRLVPIYGEEEAKAITLLVLDVRFNMSLTDVVSGKLETLSPSENGDLERIWKRLEQGEPVQYVLGQADFCGRVFRVNPSVLIPRPETERLCEWIERDQNRPFCGLKPPAPLQVLDIGTGSGCIAVTLALDLWNREVTAWDISADALIVARDNAHRLGAWVNFQQQDILHAPDDPPLWDVIVSNPPYVCDRERAEMRRNVLDHEPASALFVPDDDPLLFYRAIAAYAHRTLKPYGALYMEINPLFVSELQKLLRSLGFRSEVNRATEYENRMMKAARI